MAGSHSVGKEHTTVFGKLKEQPAKTDKKEG